LWLTEVVVGAREIIALEVTPTGMKSENGWDHFGLLIRKIGMCNNKILPSLFTSQIGC